MCLLHDFPVDIAPPLHMRGCHLQLYVCMCGCVSQAHNSVHRICAAVSRMDYTTPKCHHIHTYIPKGCPGSSQVNAEGKVALILINDGSPSFPCCKVVSKAISGCQRWSFQEGTRDDRVVLVGSMERFVRHNS